MPINLATKMKRIIPWKAELPIVTLKEIKNLNSTVSIKEVEFKIKKRLLTEKSLDPEGFTRDFYQIFEEQIIPVLHSSFKKTEEERTFCISVLRSALPLR